MVDSALSEPSELNAKRRDWLNWLLFVAWCVVVLFAVSRHEYWRDEIRAFSLARHSHSLVELFHNLKDEGHPMLWHVLLYVGYGVTGSKYVLPTVAFVVAASAVGLLIFKAPLPLWLKALFVMGGIPLYEYSVMARNYGISMLFMFLFACLYQERKRRPIWIGCTLACLANTNIHSMILAALLLALWLCDEFVVHRVSMRGKPALRIYAAMLLVALGAAFAVATVWPSGQSILVHPAHFTLASVLRALGGALSDPAGQFQSIAPREAGVPAWLSNIMLLTATIGLIRRPLFMVSAWIVVIALSVVFQLVYPGSYRHQALFVVFLMTLYWLDGAHPKAIQSRGMSWTTLAGNYVGLPALLITLVLMGAYKLSKDVLSPQSASKLFGDFIKNHPEFARSVVVAEPDWVLESLSYYVDNRLYIIRERHFGDVVRFTRASKVHLTAGELLDATRSLGQSERQEVLVLVGHASEFAASLAEPNLATPHEIVYDFGTSFSWSASDLKAWKSSMTRIAQFSDGIVGDERYDVYQLTGAHN